MIDFIMRNRKVFIFTSVAMVFMIGVSLTQLVIENLSSSSNSLPVAIVEQLEDQDVEVVSTVESINSPVGDQVSVVGKFYDITLSDEQLETALIYFEGVYRPNVGVSYGNNGETFDVYASLTGVITKKTNDPLLGWVVTITSDHGVTTTYQSLGDVYFEKDDEIKQGQLIGTSGENIYEADLGNHIHFVIEVDDVPLNPEKVIGLSVNDLS